MKKLAFAILTLSFLIAGMAMAADAVPATTETQGISTTTSIIVLGTMTNSETVAMTISTLDLRDNPPLGESGFLGFPGLEFLDPANAWYISDIDFAFSLPERQTVSSYAESIVADNGYLEFNEIQSLNTGNKVVNQDNFKSTEQFDFVSFDDAMGRATLSESILLDLVSLGSDANERLMCPFTTGDQRFIPPYCNIYDMGSSFTGSEVSEITQASTNFIAKSSDSPIETEYSAGLSGTGSASAWINTHIMEGRTGAYFDYGEPGVYFIAFHNYDTGEGFWAPDGKGTGFMQSIDIIYKEKTTASGVIESFSKSMGIQDGVRRL